MATITEPTREALDQLRDPALFQWYIVFVGVLVIWIYSTYAERGRWPAIAAGLALWFADWINEILNSFFLQATDEAPLWSETGDTAYQILVGLNVETSAMFLLFGLIYVNTLPADPRAKFLGMPNRLGIAVMMSLIAVAIEVVLNEIDVLRWHWVFWDVPFGLPLIFAFGYLWFFLAAAKAYDAPTERERWRFVAILAGVAAGLALIGGIAGWL